MKISLLFPLLHFHEQPFLCVSFVFPPSKILPITNNSQWKNFLLLRKCTFFLASYCGELNFQPKNNQVDNFTVSYHFANLKESDLTITYL